MGLKQHGRHYRNLFGRSRKQAGVNIEFPSKWNCAFGVERSILSNIPQYEEKIPHLVLDCKEGFSLRLPTGRLNLSCNKTSDALAFKCPQSLSLSPSSEVQSLRHLGKEKSLKMLFAEKNVPPWRRKNWPVLNCEDGPIIIPNIAVHDDHWVDMTKREGQSIRYLSFTTT